MRKDTKWISALPLSKEDQDLDRQRFFGDYEDMKYAVDMINMTNRKFDNDMLDFIQDSMDFLKGHLMISNDVTLFLEYSSEMDGCSGSCVQQGSKQTADFAIELSTALVNRHKKDKKEIAKVLIHELWHSKQYSSGRLTDNGIMSDVVTFDGVDYQKTMAYKRQPWEIEATKAETSKLLNLVMA